MRWELEWFVIFCLLSPSPSTSFFIGYLLSLCLFRLSFQSCRFIQLCITKSLYNVRRPFHISFLTLDTISMVKWIIDWSTKNIWMASLAKYLHTIIRSRLFGLMLHQSRMFTVKSVVSLSILWTHFFIEIMSGGNGDPVDEIEPLISKLFSA